MVSISIAKDMVAMEFASGEFNDVTHYQVEQRWPTWGPWTPRGSATFSHARESKSQVAPFDEGMTVVDQERRAWWSKGEECYRTWSGIRGSGRQQRRPTLLPDKTILADETHFVHKLSSFSGRDNSRGNLY